MCRLVLFSHQRGLPQTQRVGPLVGADSDAALPLGDLRPLVLSLDLEVHHLQRRIRGGGEEISH